MNPLEAYKPEDLVSLADPDYRESIKKRSRALSSQALETYHDVMVDPNEDGMARINAADRLLKHAGAEEPSLLVPQGVSEEVFKLALLGLTKLKELAVTTQSDSIFRDVTPAKTDPRPLALIAEDLKDDSPLSRAEGPVAPSSEPHERYEIIDRRLEPEDDALNEAETQAQGSPET